MTGIIESYAGQIAARAGSGYEYSSRSNKDRVAAIVYPDTEEAAADNLENNTLL